MFQQTNTYEIPDPMVQAIVHILNSLPAGQVRGLLNDLEATCKQQDEAKEQARISDQINRILGKVEKAE